MTTLLLRLCGPMQSWGTQSRFTVRDTGLEPSKSGVIGLLCAALGKPREESPGDGHKPLAALAALTMGVRVDREGTMRMDYQTAGATHRLGESYGVAKADGSRPSPVTSNRYYLADADFIVGLEGDRDLLLELDRALARPRWQLFLGRKSFVPSLPVRMPETPPLGPGLRDMPLAEALLSILWLGHLARRRELPPERLRLILESTDVSSEVRRDQPLSFAERRFTIRYVRTEWTPTPKVAP